MSSKLGLILSIAFMMAVLLLSGDLMNVSVVTNALNALGLTVSHRISLDGTLSDATKALIADSHATITFPQGSATVFRIGDTVTYFLSRDYDPFVLKKERMHITVRCSAVVGYYQK